MHDDRLRETNIPRWMKVAQGPVGGRRSNPDPLFWVSGSVDLVQVPADSRQLVGNFGKSPKNSGDVEGIFAKTKEKSAKTHKLDVEGAKIDEGDILGGGSRL